MYISYHDYPIGRLAIIEKDNTIIAVTFANEVSTEQFEEKNTALSKKAHQQLQEYFNGTRTVFNLPLNPQGTAFQIKCWKALQTIPYGTTVSYKELAVLIGNEKASRAVGNANNKNPLMIIIPCHRVIGSNGKLVGYRGGLAVKEYLLEHEKKPLS